MAIPACKAYKGRADCKDYPVLLGLLKTAQTAIKVYKAFRDCKVFKALLARSAQGVLLLRQCNYLMRTRQTMILWCDASYRTYHKNTNGNACRYINDYEDYAQDEGLFQIISLH